MCWVKAHSDKIISCYSISLDLDRKKADSAWKYILYFELRSWKIEKYNLIPEQVYNIDEKGFMIGINTKEKRIFSWCKYELGEHKHFLQDGNWEWITTIACICANGIVLSLALIYMSKSGNI
jgi:hypothetical protein